MKIEIEDERLLSVFIGKLVKSGEFQKIFQNLIREQIKLFGNEFFELGYKKAIQDKFEEIKNEKNETKSI
jgi:hypothetical protein